MNVDLDLPLFITFITINQKGSISHVSRESQSSEEKISLIIFLRDRRSKIDLIDRDMNKGENPTPAAAATPKPRVSASTIVYIGLAAFVLASTWPPLLLLVAAFLSVTIPYR